MENSKDDSKPKCRAAIDVYSDDEMVERITKATFEKPEQAERAFDCMKKHVDEGVYQQYADAIEHGNIRVILLNHI